MNERRVLTQFNGLSEQFMAFIHLQKLFESPSANTTHQECIHMELSFPSWMSALISKCNRKGVRKSIILVWKMGIMEKVDKKILELSINFSTCKTGTVLKESAYWSTLKCLNCLQCPSAQVPFKCLACISASSVQVLKCLKCLQVPKCLNS